MDTRHYGRGHWTPLQPPRWTAGSGTVHHHDPCGAKAAAAAGATFRCFPTAWDGSQPHQTGLILTMDRQPTAVLSGVFAAGARPYVRQLWGHFFLATQCGDC